MRTAECERCHGVTDEPQIIWHDEKQQYIKLCNNCYRFIRMLFDDVIDEYVLRKE